ncbi:MAG: hypothetical protein PHZ00_01900 [Candidatus Peribacteraceae bacterium]|nr:hypothetical protein [Candidatus Peribacteraceae bacterium]
MFSSLRNLKAFQFAASATLMTAAVVTLPLFAQVDVTVTPPTTTPATTELGMEYFAGQIASRFARIGAESGIYDNLTINSSAFDLVQYMSDGCYNVSDVNTETCKQQYGPYYSLKETMDSGALKTILMGYPYFTGVDKLFPAPTPAESHVRKLSEPEVFRLQIDHRSREVWDTCQAQFDDRMEQNRCYQRNIRLTTNRNIDVEGNVL